MSTRENLEVVGRASRSHYMPAGPLTSAGRRTLLKLDGGRHLLATGVTRLSAPAEARAKQASNRGKFAGRSKAYETTNERCLKRRLPVREFLPHRGQLMVSSPPSNGGTGRLPRASTNNLASGQLSRARPACYGACPRGRRRRRCMIPRPEARGAKQARSTSVGFNSASSQPMWSAVCSVAVVAPRRRQFSRRRTWHGAGAKPRNGLHLELLRVVAY